ncbi:MAG TPA: PfkB family carbohydrate kinase, partial [Acidimicrobiales bacterium]|nr:PfkB family carbohydrate kinase [Acidimicrobiales bacterium]
MAAHERAGTDHVLVIGDVMVDVVVVPAGPLRHGSDVPSRIRVTGGGSAANTACWLASLGRPVCLAAMVGDDPTGTGVPTSVDAASAAPLRA